MSFDEEHLDEHYECQREVAERDARVRELEAALRKIMKFSADALAIVSQANAPKA
jgi:hypothetical protein